MEAKFEEDSWFILNQLQIKRVKKRSSYGINTFTVK